MRRREGRRRGGGGGGRVGSAGDERLNLEFLRRRVQRGREAVSRSKRRLSVDPERTSLPKGGLRSTHSNSLPSASCSIRRRICAKSAPSSP